LISGLINVSKRKKPNIDFISPENNSCPASYKKVIEYYPNYNCIAKKIAKKENKKIELKKIYDNNYLYNFPKLNFNNYEKVKKNFL
jgi:hypothetical protein